MGADEKSLLENCLGAKSEPGTARLYHITAENAMGTGEKSLRCDCRGAESEGGTAAAVYYFNEKMTEKRKTGIFPDKKPEFFRKFCLTNLRKYGMISVPLCGGAFVVPAKMRPFVLRDASGQTESHSARRKREASFLPLPQSDSA